MQNSISLFQLNKLVKDSLKLNFDFSTWIFAEIDEIKLNQSGHCYLELIEKSEESDSIIAKAKGIIWAKQYRMIKAYFESETGIRLEQGIKILICVEIEFHEIYGYSLIIKDIEPAYTIGEKEKRKLDIIKRLKEDGVFDMNKNCDFPTLPKNIAIISSENAAGYNDFIKHLENNSYKFKFHYKLFPAFLQGENMENSVINALDKIYNYENLFDLVVIIRGGGSKSDLGWFDNYLIASNIAQFPIPVITGIGHEHDDTIADMVAYLKLKTPTAVADFLIEQFLIFHSQITDYEDALINYSENLILSEKNNLESNSQKFRLLIKNRIDTNKNNLKFLSNKISSETKQCISNSHKNLNNIPKHISNLTNQNLKINKLKLLQLIDKSNRSSNKLINEQSNKLKFIEEYLRLVNPKNILTKGYSITKINGKLIKSTNQLEKNDIIETSFKDGKVSSKVLK